MASGMVISLLSAISVAAAAPHPPEEMLWPANPPGYQATKEPERIEERGDTANHDRFVLNVSVPSISVYRPSPTKTKDMAVIVCPGGGFEALALDREGLKACSWLNSIGITAVLLKYRTAVTHPDSPGIAIPLVDLQRAIKVTRSRARDLRINPDKIGVLGFSAGGLLALWSGTRYVVRPSGVDSLEQLSCRPDFLILIYPPVYPFVGNDLDRHLSPTVPPLFVVYAINDFLAGGAASIVSAAHTAEVPLELHVFPTGGHGFGLGTKGEPVALWPSLCEHWLMQALPPILSTRYSVNYSGAPREMAYHRRINCGAAVDYQDSLGYIWEADPLYKQGGSSVYRGPIPISGTTVPEIYRSERYGMDEYRIKVPSGSYEVRLHFAETFWQVTAAGHRLFSVSIQKRLVLENFDVFAEAGNKRECAVVKSFPVSVRDSTVTISFRAVRDAPLINGIEIIAK